VLHLYWIFGVVLCHVSFSDKLALFGRVYKLRHWVLGVLVIGHVWLVMGICSLWDVKMKDGSRSGRGGRIGK